MEAAIRGKRNSQNFIQLPFNTLIHKIKYRAEENGINVLIHEESYTGKCSFPDNESIRHHKNYAGKRISRSVFRSANGIPVHAGLQASYNIIKRTIPEASANGIGGIGLYPQSLSIKEIITARLVC